MTVRDESDNVVVVVVVDDDDGCGSVATQYVYDDNAIVSWTSVSYSSSNSCIRNWSARTRTEAVHES